MTLLHLFVSFLQVGLLSIGGGYAAIPLIKSQVIGRWGWLTMEEFANLVTIAEMTPGPIAVNAATFVGSRIGGAAGAVAATAGCLLPSCLIVSLLALLYRRYRRVSAMQQVLGSLRSAVVALIAAAGLSILEQVVFGGEGASAGSVRLTGLVLFVLAFAALRKLKWNPILTMALCGAARLGIYAWAHV